MAKSSRNSLAALLLSCLLLPAIAQADAPSIEERKLAAVNSALGRGAGAEAQNILRAALSAAAVLSLSLDEDAAQTTLIIETTQVPECNAFSLEKGGRLVIDLKNAINVAADSPMIRSANSLIKDVRMDLFSYEPDFVSRIVLDLSIPSDFRVERFGHGIQITVRAKDRAMSIMRSLRYGGDLASAIAVEDQLLIQIRAPRQNLPLPAGHPPVWKENAALLDELIGQLANFNTSSNTPSSTRSNTPLNASLPAIARPEAVKRVQTPAPQKLAAPGASARARSAPQRTARLAKELRLVATADIDLGLGAPGMGRSAAQAQESAPGETETGETETNAEEDSGEETAPAQADAPAPPGPRDEAPADTPSEKFTDANRALVNKLHELLNGAETATEASGPAPDHAVALPPAIQPVENAVVEAISMPAADAPTVVVAPPAPMEEVYRGDPMQMPVTLSFREVEVNEIVAILKIKAGINVIYRADLSEKVTVELEDVPLRQAMETVLSIVDLGFLERRGIYYIVPYQEAVSATKVQKIVSLEHADPAEIKTILDDIIAGTPDSRYVTVSANETSNLVVLSGPRETLEDLARFVAELDIAPEVFPIVTEAIQLNYATPTEVLTSMIGLATPEFGSISANDSTRHIIVKDTPIVVEQVRGLIAQLDIAVKRVAIDALLIDVSLSDQADTGVDWLLDVLRRRSRRAAGPNGDGNAVGNLQELSFAQGLGMQSAAGAMSFGILSDRIDLRGLIQAEIRNSDSRLISNPQLVTIENQTAKLEITQQIPYIELKSNDLGGQATTTQFKDVGTILEVTPRVTHDNQIIAKILAKESGTAGEFNGVPIEDLRQVTSTVRLNDGETIFMAGARERTTVTSVRKIPFLGDIPVVNFLFRNNSKSEIIHELLIFLTCKVIADDAQLSEAQREQYEEFSEIKVKVDVQKSLINETVHPELLRDPFWQWRRSE